MRAGRKALGGSALAQVFGQVGNVAPDVHDVQLLKGFADALERLHDSSIVMAYHGRFVCRASPLSIQSILHGLGGTPEERPAACFDRRLL